MDHEASSTSDGTHALSRLATATTGSDRPVVVTAWLFVVVGTNVPRLVATVVFGADVPWLAPAQAAAVAGLLVLTLLDERFRTLQSFSLALLAVTVTRLVGVTDLLGLVGASLPPGLPASVASLFYKGLLAVVVLAVLLGRGDRRESLFVRPSDLSATAVPEWVPGFRRERSWRRLGTLHGGLAVMVTTVFLVVAGANLAVWTVPVERLLPVAVLVVAAAAVNAFAEEFLFRAAPLADLRGALGRNHAMVLLGALFGLSHYYGTPGGVPGVLMTFFLGWWLTKSLLETRGVTLAWTVHFLLDVVILLAWLLTT